MRACSIRIVAASLLATAACRPTPAESTSPPEPTATKEPTPAAPEKLEGDAVVRAGARIYVAPTGDEGFELRSLHPSPGLAVHIVGEQEGRIAIETVAANEHHCAAVLEPFAQLRVRFFVAAADLLPVLTEDVEHAFDDGTKVLLSRGVPLEHGGDFVARGTSVRVPVPASRTGRAFAPGEPRALDGAQMELAKWGDPLEYNGETLREDHLHAPRGAVLYYAAIEHGDRALVTVRNACLEVTATVPRARLKPTKEKSGLYAMKGPKDPVPEMDKRHDTDGELGRDGIHREVQLAEVVVREASAKLYDVKADTPVWSADGRPAGKLVVDHRFDLFAHAEGDRRCLRAPTDRTGLFTHTLCFDPAAVVEAPRTGYGSGGGPNSPARVRQAKAEVKGALDPDIVRRIVRAHINEVRHCYDQGLARNPKLAGRIAISFTINADGSVTASDVAETSLADASVGECIRKAAKRWEFPKPEGGGTVQVSYPFNLDPG